MKTTCHFLDAIKSRYNLPSDYAAAGKLGITRSAVSSYRKGKSFFDDHTALTVATLLEIDPGIVLACAHAERARNDAERSAWTSILEKLGGVAASVLIGLGGLSAPAPVQASQDVGVPSMYIMSNHARYPSPLQKAATKS